jgi:hypothetical protein
MEFLPKIAGCRLDGQIKTIPNKPAASKAIVDGSGTLLGGGAARKVSELSAVKISLSAPPSSKKPVVPPRVGSRKLDGSPEVGAVIGPSGVARSYPAKALLFMVSPFVTSLLKKPALGKDESGLTIMPMEIGSKE